MMEPDAFRALVYERAEKERRRAKKRTRTLISAAVMLVVLVPAAVFGLTRGRNSPQGLVAEDRQPAETAKATEKEDSRTGEPKTVEAATEPGSTRTELLEAYFEEASGYADRATPDDAGRFLLSVPGWETKKSPADFEVGAGPAEPTPEKALSLLSFSA